MSILQLSPMQPPAFMYEQNQFGRESFSDKEKEKGRVGFSRRTGARGENSRIDGNTHRIVVPESILGLENLSFDEGLVRRPFLKKRVSFSNDTKTWDGLRLAEADFDELIFCFIVKGQVIGDGDILQWTRNDSFRIFNMCRLLGDLLARVRQGDGEGESRQVPCLPNGGGRVMRVEGTLEPYLLSLLAVVTTALRISLSSSGKKPLDKMNGEDLRFLRYVVDNKCDAETFITLLSRD